MGPAKASILYCNCSRYGKNQGSSAVHSQRTLTLQVSRAFNKIQARLKQLKVKKRLLLVSAKKSNQRTKRSEGKVYHRRPSRAWLSSNGFKVDLNQNASRKEEHLFGCH